MFWGLDAGVLRMEGSAFRLLGYLKREAAALRALPRWGGERSLLCVGHTHSQCRSDEQEVDTNHTLRAFAQAYYMSSLLILHWPKQWQSPK